MSKHRNKKNQQQIRKRLREEHLSSEIRLSFIAINRYIDNICGGVPKARNGSKKLTNLSESQNHKCHYCGTNTWHPYNKTNWDKIHNKSYATRATLDHLLPRSKGGTRHNNNVVMACGECNNAKSDLSVKEFLKIIRESPKNFIKQPPTKKEERKRYKKDKKRMQLLILAAHVFPVDFEYVVINMNNYIARTMIKTPRDPEKIRGSVLNKIRHRVQVNKMAA